MKKALRTVTSALFLMSIFCLASCNRNSCCWNNSPCEVRCQPPCACPPPCGPCAPKCDPCQPCLPNCGPCCSTPSSVEPCETSCNDFTGAEIAYNEYCSGNYSYGHTYNPGYYNGCGQPVPQPCAPEANPYGCNGLVPCGSGNCNQPVPECVCYGNLRTYQTCDDCVVDLYQVAPEFATVGAPYPIEINITARKECADVVVNQLLPQDAEFVRSEPCATPDANGYLHWEFHHMVKGECQRIVVWVKPQKEGCCLAQATICACPQLCAYTRCGQPVICIKKCGPACACLYCPITYRIDVCNSGSATAYDVVVQDTVPEGLTHSTGYRCLTYELGDLGPGQSRTFNIDFCACQPGTVTNVATVSYCGGPKCTAEATTLINKPCVEVTKTGPDWAYICKTVDYTITVTNPGDLVLSNVVVDDISPAGTTIVAAPGAEVCCNRATWTICQLCPGETRTFTVSVSSQVAGCLTNKVTVTSQSDCGPCTMCAEAPTCWKGIAATHMCMVDTCDPICIGQTTVYRICVTNRGTADDTNVQLVVKFSNELQPQGVNGPSQGSISGNTVTFAPVDRLAPKQSVEYCITVKGVAVGNASAEASLTSDTLSAPDVDVESTHVY